MEIKILTERHSIQKIEKVFELEVEGKKLVVAKWSMFEEGSGDSDDGWNIIGGIDAYGELGDEQLDQLDNFINNLNIL